MTDRNEQFLKSFYSILSEKIENLELRFITPAKRPEPSPIQSASNSMAAESNSPKKPGSRNLKKSHLISGEDMADIRNYCGRSKRTRSVCSDEPEVTKKPKITPIFSKSYGDEEYSNFSKFG
jgi:hypothetical protein